MPIPLIAPIVAAGSSLSAAIMAGLGAVVARSFAFVFQFFAFKLARNIAVATGAAIIAAALTVGMAVAIKGMIVGVRMMMPPALAQATYFLPANINLVLAAIVTIKVTHFIWQWSMKNLAKYTMQITV